MCLFKAYGLISLMHVHTCEILTTITIMNSSIMADKLLVLPHCLPPPPPPPPHPYFPVPRQPLICFLSLYRLICISWDCI